jgi:hypothetical protein
MAGLVVMRRILGGGGEVSCGLKKEYVWHGMSTNFLVDQFDFCGCPVAIADGLVVFQHLVIG